MTKPNDVMYVHTPKPGHFVAGIPARDLTQADVDRLGEARIHAAVATGLYTKASKQEQAHAAAEQAKADKAQPTAEKGTDR